jgi:hypothetical protein
VSVQRGTTVPATAGEQQGHVMLSAAGPVTTPCKLLFLLHLVCMLFLIAITARDMLNFP